MIIVIGNHDILPVSLFLESDMQVYQTDYEEEDFIFTHHPKVELDGSKFVFAGHVHPVFTTYGKGRQSMRLPCFVVDNHQAILTQFRRFYRRFSNGFGRRAEDLYYDRDEGFFSLLENWVIF